MDKVFREIKRQTTFFWTNTLDFPAHIHEDIELVFVKSGGGTAYCDGKRYELCADSFFLVFPNQVHHYSDCSGEYILLILKASRLLSNSDVFLQGHPSCAVRRCDGDADDYTALLLKMAVDEYEKNGYGSLIDAYLTTFFEKLIPLYDIEKGVAANDTVLRILQYCSDHYSEEITVSDVAEKLHISKSSVSHIFSSRLAVHFCDHINSLRLLDAVRLLRNTEYSITDISDLAGFPTVRTFNRVFQKRYHMTPSAYRKQLNA